MPIFCTHPKCFAYPVFAKNICLVPPPAKLQLFHKEVALKFRYLSDAQSKSITRVYCEIVTMENNEKVTSAYDTCY